MGLVEKIIAEIDSGWSPRVAARRAGSTEYALMRLSKENKELRIKMDLYSLQRLEAKRGPEGSPVAIEFVDKRKSRGAIRVDRYLPIKSPIYRKRLG